MKESKIDALQSYILSGRAGRQSQVDKRRIEAVERLWLATLELRAFRVATTNLTLLNLDNIEKALPSNQNLKAALEAMRGDDLAQQIKADRGEYERPFVSLRTWSLYSALKTILHICYVKVFLVTNEVRNSDRLINFDNVKEMVKAVLPHHAEYIEKNGFRGIALLIDEIEDLLLASLQNTLSGDEADDADLEKSARIIRLSHEIQSRETMGSV